MHSVCANVFKSMIAASVLLLAALAAGAAPLPRDAASASGDGRAERRLSDTDLVLSDPRLDLPEISSGSNYSQLLGPGANRRGNSADPQAFDFGQAGAGQSMQEMLRGFVTVRRSSGPSSAAQPRANNRRPPEDALGLDLGFSSNEWVRESVQGVMGSVLSLAVDERGNASFSVLGLGDFSVIISADRSELALTSGDEVLATARRAETGPVAGAGYPGYGGYTDGQSGSPASLGPTESPLRRALELALEVASHPLSFIVYALLGGYALVWGIYSARTRRSSSGSGSRHSSHHYSVSSPLHAAAMIPAPVVKKARKRIRVRVRARKYR